MVTEISPSLLHTHTLTPGDHYSSRTGSAIPNIVYEISKWHVRRGGTSQILTARGTDHDYPVGQCIEYELYPRPGRAGKLADAALGRLGLERVFMQRAFRPLAEAMSRDYDGVVFVHNAPAAVSVFRRLCPKALICLWANNALYNTYSAGEVRRVVEKADRLICCSQFIANDLQGRLSAPSERVKVVHNGVDIERFQPRTAPNADEIPIILFVGRVRQEKGPDLLLRAAQKVFQSGRKFKVRIVGSSNFNAKDPITPYQQELFRLAEPLGAAVEFQPFVDRAKVLEEYQAASLFCVPSDWDDPCPLTVLEGMACGLPVITTRRGGIPEEGGDAVLYFQPPDIETLAEHLTTLLDDPSVRADWGRRARLRAETFSWEFQYDKLCRAIAS